MLAQSVSPRERVRCQSEQIFVPSRKSLDLSKWYGIAPKMQKIKRLKDLKTSKCPGVAHRPPKCSILRLKFQNYLGVVPPPPSPTQPPSNWYGKGPKMHCIKVKISKFPEGSPQTIFPPPEDTPLGALHLAHGTISKFPMGCSPDPPPHLPPQIGMKQPPKCTIFEVKI